MSSDKQAIEQWRLDLQKRSVNVLRGTKSRTLYLRNSMDDAERNARVDECHKHIPTGSILTIQYDDGVYSLGANNAFQGFYGGGLLRVQGNTADASSLNTAQSVYLDGGSLEANALNFVRCFVIVQVWKLKIRTKTDIANRSAISFNLCPNFDLVYSYLLGTSTTYGYLAYCQYSNGRILSTNFSNASAGIWSDYNSSITGASNADTGTMPKYGQVGSRGYINRNSVFIDGSISDDLESAGGRVFT